MIPLSRINIKGLAEGILQMSTGGERRLWVPEKLAFEGKQGRPAGTIVSDVQLLQVL